MKKIKYILILGLLANMSYGKVKMATYESVKQKSMGGATILSEVNENALVNNPALLNEIDKWELNIFGLAIGVEKDTPDTAEGMMQLIDDLDELSEADDQDIVDLLQAYLNGVAKDINGKTYNTERYQLSNKKVVAELNQVIAFAKKNFGVGVFTTVKLNDLRIIDKPSSPEIIADLSGSVQVPIGFSFDFGKNKQYVLGASFKGVGGANGYAEADAGDISSDNEVPVKTEVYTGYTFDIGSIWRTKYLNYSLTANNVYSDLDVTVTEHDIDTDYSGQKLPTSINFAISNKYDKEDRLDKWWDKHLFWTLEFKNLTSEDLDVDGYKDDDFYKKIHFGASTMVFNNKWLKLDLRGGLNQGYPTFGFGTELFSFFNVDYSYSTREKGTTAGMDGETLHSLAIDFRI